MTDVDDMLKAVPSDEDGETDIDDGVLMAYHEGRLSKDEARKVEGQLASSQEGRDLLRALAEPAPADLLQWGEASLPQSGVGRRARWGAGIGGLAVAAAALVMLGPPSEVYQAPYTMNGPYGAIVSDRGDAPSAASLRFGPTSSLSVVFVTETPAERSIALTVYVTRGTAGLKQVDVGPYVQIDPANKAIELNAPAGELFEGPPGTRTLYWVLHDSKDKMRNALADAAAFERQVGLRTHGRVDVMYIGD